MDIDEKQRGQSTMSTIHRTRSPGWNATHVLWENPRCYHGELHFTNIKSDSLGCSFVPTARQSSYGSTSKRKWMRSNHRSGAPAQAESCLGQLFEWCATLDFRRDFLRWARAVFGQSSCLGGSCQHTKTLDGFGCGARSHHAGQDYNRSNRCAREEVEWGP